MEEGGYVCWWGGLRGGGEEEGLGGRLGLGGLSEGGRWWFEWRKGDWGLGMDGWVWAWSFVLEK